MFREVPCVWGFRTCFSISWVRLGGEGGRGNRGERVLLSRGSFPEGRRSPRRFVGGIPGRLASCSLDFSLRGLVIRWCVMSVSVGVERVVDGCGEARCVLLPGGKSGGVTRGLDYILRIGGISVADRNQLETKRVSE